MGKCGGIGCDANVAVVPDVIEQSGAGFEFPTPTSGAKVYTTFLPAVSWECSQQYYVCGWKRTLRVEDAELGRYCVGREAAVAKAKEYIEREGLVGE